YETTLKDMRMSMGVYNLYRPLRGLRAETTSSTMMPLLRSTLETSESTTESEGRCKDLAK
ncbi:hypothetical protein ABMA28_015322, partial [Loxostege sticticalis]